MLLIALRQIMPVLPFSEITHFFNIIAIIWNGIPEDIKVATTLCSFKRQLKSFYFKRLFKVFDGDNVRSLKIICPKCRRVNILKACSC